VVQQPLLHLLILIGLNERMGDVAFVLPALFFGHTVNFSDFGWWLGNIRKVVELVTAALGFIVFHRFIRSIQLYFNYLLILSFK